MLTPKLGKNTLTLTKASLAPDPIELFAPAGQLTERQKLSNGAEKLQL